MSVKFDVIFSDQHGFQGTQFLPIENNRNSHCFTEQNNAACCLPINRNCVP